MIARLRASRPSPRSNARRTSPSVTVPRSRPAPSTTSAIWAAPPSMVAIASRTETSGDIRTFFQSTISVLACRVTLDAGMIGHIPNHDRTSGYQRVLSNPNALDNDCPGADMGALADMHPPGKHGAWRHVDMGFENTVVIDLGPRVD